MGDLVESGGAFTATKVQEEDFLNVYLDALGFSEDEVAEVAASAPDVIDRKVHIDTLSTLSGAQRVIGGFALITAVVGTAEMGHLITQDLPQDSGETRSEVTLAVPTPNTNQAETVKPAPPKPTKAPSATTPPPAATPPATTPPKANGPTCATNAESRVVPLNPAAAAEIPNLAAVCQSVLETHVSLSQVNKGPARDVPYQYARRECAAAAQTGTRQLYDFIHYTWNTSANKAYGVTPVCRNIAGTNSPSIHTEGRAMDVGLNAHDAVQKAHGDQLFAWAIKNAHILGIQEVIWNGQIWTSDHGLRKYNEANQHTDHVHLALTWTAAKAQTPAYELGILKVRIRA